MSKLPQIQAVHVKRMQTQDSSLLSCFSQSASEPRVRQTKKEKKGEHLHNVGA